ncbi:MAG: glycosyltransferase [Gammaproteobacteria bacterium]|nr:glycosyltransferase [Gammaproteobacteria bacterium]
MLVTELILLVLAVPALAFSLYLLVLTLLSRAERAITPDTKRRLRFDVIVPAHNEQAAIETVVGNLSVLDWPQEGFRILVVADNCTDATAALARAAGAHVLVRHDEEKRGKGYALEYAFAESRQQGWADAVVVVDADTQVSGNMLAAFAARIENGAKVIQAHYGVANVHASWRTRLMAIALAAFHQVRSRGRERLKLSCGLRGNGWCVTHALLREVPYRAYSLAEDIEYGIDLGMAGYRVEYADEVQVAGMMVSGEQASRSQRQRWEGGRWELLRSRILPLLRAGVGRGGKVCLDLAMDLIVPPLSYVFLNIVIFVLLASLVAIIEHSATGWLFMGLFCMTTLMMYVLRGWQLSGVGMRGLLDLLRAPFFVLWKVLLMLRRRGPGWIRTEREPS